MTRYILDSFALLALNLAEPGAIRVRQLLADQDHRHWMSVVHLGEVYYRLFRVLGEDAAGELDQVIEDLQITVVFANETRSLSAARLKAVYPISYADCFAAALAQELDATVLTGDREFERLERDGVIRVEWLTRRV